MITDITRSYCWQTYLILIFQSEKNNTKDYNFLISELKEGYVLFSFDNVFD